MVPAGAGCKSSPLLGEQDRAAGRRSIGRRPTGKKLDDTVRLVKLETRRPEPSLPTASATDPAGPAGRRAPAFNPHRAVKRDLQRDVPGRTSCRPGPPALRRRLRREPCRSPRPVDAAPDPARPSGAPDGAGAVERPSSAAGGPDALAGCSGAGQGLPTAGSPIGPGRSVTPLASRPAPAPPRPAGGRRSRRCSPPRLPGRSSVPPPR